VTSSSRTRSFGLIGVGFVVAGVVAACGGSSSTAAPATTAATSAPVVPTASSGPVVATAAEPIVTNAAPTSAVPTSAVPTSAVPVPTSAAPKATKAAVTTTPKPAVKTTTKSAAPTTTMSMSMSMSPTPTKTTAKPTTPAPTKTTPKPVVTTPSAPKAVTVTAVETEFKIALSRTSFSPGTVTFVVENKGTATHALGVDGPGVNKTTDDLDAGTSGRLTVTLAKGSYDIYCPIANHKMLGMDLHITVS
jgi:uncharacterized cupredoxin-like copper-binding protein